MDEMHKVRFFTEKWLEKFRDENIDYLELVGHWLADDCKELGFEMDCGHAFAAQYGNAVNNADAFQVIYDKINDIALLGSAIYSRWRFFNHWAYTGAEILEPQNCRWFILALTRLSELAI